MNDEIKEILDNKLYFDLDEEDYIKIKDYITNLQQEKPHLHTNTEWEDLLDYKGRTYIELDRFKQVQQENETLHENNQNMQEEMARVWEENETLKAKYDNNKSHEINYKYFTTLYSKATKDIVIDDLVYKCEDLDNLKQSYEKLYIEKEDYKSRCEKAIEYINKNKHLSMFADCREPEEEWNYDLECGANDLLNILQNGSEKDG